MNIVFLFIIFLAILGIASGLTCHDCVYWKSGTDIEGQGCKDNPSSGSSQSCDDKEEYPQYPHCARFEASNSSHHFIIRGCVSESKDGQDTCDHEVDSPFPEIYEKTGHLCLCQKDNCNQALCVRAALKMLHLLAIATATYILN